MGGMVTEMGRCLMRWESMPCLYEYASATTHDCSASFDPESLDRSKEMEKSCISDMNESRLRL
jgi:hypothetical protein